MVSKASLPNGIEIVDLSNSILITVLKADMRTLENSKFIAIGAIQKYVNQNFEEIEANTYFIREDAESFLYQYYKQDLEIGE